MAKISIVKKEGIIEKNSYERHAYGSVDDISLSYVISQKSTENKTLALMGELSFKNRFLPSKCNCHSTPPIRDTCTAVS